MLAFHPVDARAIDAVELLAGAALSKLLGVIVYPIPHTELYVILMSRY